jgi:hypothetical protein
VLCDRSERVEALTEGQMGDALLAWMKGLRVSRLRPRFRRCTGVVMLSRLPIAEGSSSSPQG